MLNLKKTKKAQVWSLDLIIAAIIFAVGLIVVYIFTLNLPGQAEEKLNSLIYEGNLIASALLTEGGPTNWDELADSNPDAIILPGLIRGDKIDYDKINNFSNLTHWNSPLNLHYPDKKYPEKMKNKLSTIYDFCISLTGYPITICTANPVNQNNVISVTRFTVYQNKPSTLTIQVWDI